MYRRGLTGVQISRITGAPTRTVGYHLALAKKLHPELQSEHLKAGAGRHGRVTRRGLELMTQLIGMVEETGRFPSAKAPSKSERALAAWLNRRRNDERAGTLTPAFRDGLSNLLNWQGTSRTVADEAKWRERLAALAAYRKLGNDWPRHEPTAVGTEHELGVWLHMQRYKERRGSLDIKRAAALDEAVPGWRLGRTRGRKPTK